MAAEERPEESPEVAQSASEVGNQGPPLPPVLTQSESAQVATAAGITIQQEQTVPAEQGQNQEKLGQQQCKPDPANAKRSIADDAAKESEAPPAKKMMHLDSGTDSMKEPASEARKEGDQGSGTGSTQESKAQQNQGGKDSGIESKSEAQNKRGRGRGGGRQTGGRGGGRGDLKTDSASSSSAARTSASAAASGIAPSMEASGIARSMEDEKGPPPNAFKMLLAGQQKRALDTE